MFSWMLFFYSLGGVVFTFFELRAVWSVRIGCEASGSGAEPS